MVYGGVVYVTQAERDTCRAAMIAQPGPTADALLDHIEALRTQNAELREFLKCETPREKELEMCLTALLDRCKTSGVMDIALMSRIERALTGA